MCVAPLCCAGCDLTGPTETFMGPEGPSSDERAALVALVSGELQRTLGALEQGLSCGGMPCSVDMQLDTAGEGQCRSDGGRGGWANMHTPGHSTLSATLRGQLTGDMAWYAEGSGELQARRETTNCFVITAKAQLVTTATLEISGSVKLEYGSLSFPSVPWRSVHPASLRVVGDVRWVSARVTNGSCRVDLHYGGYSVAPIGSVCDSSVVTQ
jgi:hypothetical protein